MLCVLLVLLYLYIGPARTLLSDLHQSSARRAQVLALERTNAELRSQEQTLAQPSTLEAQARNLGLVRRGEREYVVKGLPDN